MNGIPSGLCKLLGSLLRNKLSVKTGGELPNAILAQVHWLLGQNGKFSEFILSYILLAGPSLGIREPLELGIGSRLS